MPSRALACFALLLAACSTSRLTEPDASSFDAGVDAAAPAVDAGTDATVDASTPPDTGPEGADIGEPCVDDDACRYPDDLGDELPECLGGPTPFNNGNAWTNGYCVTPCAPPPAIVDGAALEQGDCPDGALCVPFREEYGLCLRGCESDDDCRTEDGYYCRRAFGGGINEDPSTSNGVCMASHCQSRGCPRSAVCAC
ncbi:hypothetical protein [Sandaracinus amylolyticus]|uniref:Uncharacterized protein n=1 Tax=Sandaracinus amylolyticus TaxID=927083 RepID=A0A0F6SGL8_9BACT|nr:hypothetical protein [Sandaracinus amylolyticus]AKF08919.1 hypothetical protein DB32_006068 [Sandaracinus amylolyticus]